MTDARVKQLETALRLALAIEREAARRRRWERIVGAAIWIVGIGLLIWLLRESMP